MSKLIHARGPLPYRGGIRLSEQYARSPELASARTEPNSAGESAISTSRNGFVLLMEPMPCGL